MKAQDQAKPENNPSMDEILQSIRGVINEDGVEENKIIANSSDKISEDVLELTEVVEAEPIKSGSKEVKIVEPVKTPEVVIPKEPIIQPPITETPSKVTVVPEKTSEKVPEKILEPLANKSENKPIEEVTMVDPAPIIPSPTVALAENILKPEENIASEATIAPIPDMEVTTQVSDEIISTKNSTSTAESAIEEADNILINKPADQVVSKDKTLEEKQKNHLVSDKVANEATTAIKDLMNIAFKPQTDGVKFRSGTTVEEIVVEAIKPYLSQWLDENLPSIVKNLVEKEIKKLMPNDD